MRTKVIPATLLSLLVTLIATGTIARAADDTELEYDVTARVVRVSLIKGEVSVKRQGSTEWESVKINLPLVEGDTVATGSDGRAEIQIDARNFARLDSDSVLKIVTLRDEGIALSLSRGTATVRLARLDRDREYFEIDAPRTTFAAERKGLYRVDVAPSDRVQVTVRDDGRARVYSETSGFIVRDGQTATLDFSASEEGDWHFAQALAKDGWDDWVTNREAYLAARLRYDDRVRYYDSDLWGAEELDAYGNWAYVNDYGWIWRPHVSVINNYNNWAPYRHGYWTWCPPYGWTWVGYEPWGWAPYHYGRWVYHNNYWAWCPRGPNHRRSWWRPALVAFVSLNFNFGSSYCWYPLPYHHRDPRSRHYGRDDRWRGMRPEELARLRRVDPAYFRAVTSQAAGQFGSRNARPQPASTELARRAIGMEPLRGDVPIRPAGNVDRGSSVAGDRQARNAIARPASVTAALLERPTGAAVRQPGVALDEELRRSRILNGRELVRPANPTVGGTSIGDSVTGAVLRQAARPVREPGTRDKEDGGNPGDSSPVERTARPMAKPGIDIKGNDGNPGTPIERPARPAREPGARSNDRNTGGSSPVERPARPMRDPVNREKEPDRSNDAPATPRRSEPSPRYEPPARSDPPPQRSEPSPRYEPPARSDPPPQRSEPSPRYEPPARSDPPPQRSEPSPRYEPPARSDPPPQRSEPPARSDPPPQRSEPAPHRSEPTKPSGDRPSRAERKNDG